MDTYSTKNLSLAAYLLSEGFELQEIQVDERKMGTFIFPNDSKAIQEKISDFRQMKAVGNIVMYEQARHGLLERIKYQGA